MPSVKDIQRRIKSVNNTKKITKAMEMVAAAKMRRAVEGVLRTRTYANLSWETIINLSRTRGDEALGHPLLLKRDKMKSIGIVLITSNRGLCGGFNMNIVNKVHKSIERHHKKGSQEEIKTEFILIGKKGAAVRKYFGYDIAAEFPKLDLVSEVKEVIPIAKLIIDDYLSGKYDKIMAAYTDFVSPSVQIPRVKQLLPLDFSAEDEYLGIVGQDTRVGLDKDFIEAKEDVHLGDGGHTYEYAFEPNPRKVLDEIIPRLIEVQLFQAMLESNASEHSARMSSMHKANEAAGDLARDLTLFCNKARQAEITNEIAEISAGANALKDR